MRIRRRNWFFRRFALVLAVAAVAVPTAQAKHDQDGGGQQAAKQYIAGVTDFPSAIVVGEAVKTGEYGMPRAMPSDYAKARGDGIELVRLDPRSTARQFDGIENVRVEPRTGSPELVASPGFDWSDAGIGAGLALLLVALGGGALLASRNVKPQTA